MNQAHCRLDAALVKVQHTEEYVFILEAELDIQECWMESTPEYQDFQQLNLCMTYSKALDELKCLVVMWLFELVKMRASGTGEKLPHCEFNADVQMGYVQDTSFVIKLAEPYSGGLKQSEKPLSDTTRRRHVSTLHAPPCLGVISSNIALLASLTYSVIPEMMFTMHHGPSQHVARLHSSFFNFVRLRRS